MEFSTYGADNDNTRYRNCARYRGGGFWWNDCGQQSVNGHYSGIKYDQWQKIWWGDHYYLKKIRLMIRPAA